MQIDEFEVASHANVSTRDSLMMVNWVKLEQDVEMSFTSKMDNLRQVDAEHCSFIEVVLGKDAKLRAANKFLCFVDVCALN